jgi:hypothetical protein
MKGSEITPGMLAMTRGSYLEPKAVVRVLEKDLAARGIRSTGRKDQAKVEYLTGSYAGRVELVGYDMLRPAPEDALETSRARDASERRAGRLAKLLKGEGADAHARGGSVTVNADSLAKLLGWDLSDAAEFTRNAQPGA